MLLKSIIAASALLISNVDGKSVEDYIKDIRKHSKMPITPAAPATVDIPVSSLVETDALKKPLTVSQFSEWLHNLYYDEEKKRKSAIKYMLESHSKPEAQVDTYDLQ